MSFILLGILNSQAQAAGGAYFAMTAYDPNAVGSILFRGITKELVVNGQTSISGNQAGILTKLNADGTINWQKTVRNTTGDVRVFSTKGIVSDGTTTYAMYQDESTGNSDLVLVKFDGTPSITTQRRLGGADNYKVDASNIDNDSSFNIVAGGYYEVINSELIWGVWNSSLTFQFQRRVDPSTGDIYDPRFKFDSSGNVLVAAQWNNSPTRMLVVKYNSSGTSQWQRTLTGSSDLAQMAVTNDTSDNIYVSYRDQNTSGWGAGLAKWNSSGTLQWQKTLARTGWNYQSNGDVVYGTDGNIYAAHTVTNTNGDGVILVASYDSSGNVNWQRYIDFNISGASPTIVNDLTLDANNNLVLTGYTLKADYSIRYGISLVLPSDGNFIGTYTDGSITMNGSASSHSLSTTSYTSATSTLTLNTPSLTEASSSVSLNNITLTEQKIDIG